MQLAEPLQASWKAHLALDFEAQNGKTVLARKHSEGPLVVQKALYPEGPEVCHAIVVALQVRAETTSTALLTTPGAGKWYRSGGPWAKQKLAFEVQGNLEWLPRETIVFDGALADLECEVKLASEASYIGWEVLCLGRTGSGERFTRGKIRIQNRIVRNDKLLWMERGEIDGGGRLLSSPVGLGGRSVCGTFVATGVPSALLAECRKIAVTTLLPGLLIARYLGDSSEEALACFASLWQLLRPVVMGRQAARPRIWST
jgi:urease accessory protein